MDALRLPDDMASELIDHAQAEYPKEACGIIGGPPGVAAKLYLLRNIDPDPVMRYMGDAHEQKRAQDDMFEHGWDTTVVFHSHTHSPAFPSDTDVERAFYPDAVYLLVSLMDRGKPDLRAFRIINGNITEIGVVRESVEKA